MKNRLKSSIEDRVTKEKNFKRFEEKRKQQYEVIKRESRYWNEHLARLRRKKSYK